MIFPTGRIRDDSARDAARSIPSDHPLLTTEPIWTSERRDNGFVPLLGRNDVQPVCTSVGTMNMLRFVAKLQGFDLDVIEAAVQPFYASCVGIENTAAAIMASHGAVMASVMGHLEDPGYNVGPQTYLGFARTIPKDKTAIANAIATWGCVGAGIGVPADIVLDGSTWHAEAHATAEDHFVPLFSATADDISFGTWGEICLMGWDYLDQSGDEFWVPIFPQLVKPDGTYLGKPFSTLMEAFEA